MVRTRVGYCGGKQKSPTYRSIGDHSESIQVEYDPTKVSYEQLLAVFWADHDPTYRSSSRQYQAFVFVKGDAQARVAQASLADVASRDKGACRPRSSSSTRSGPPRTTTRSTRSATTALLMAELHAMYPDETAFRESTAAARINGWLGGSGTLASFRAISKDLGLSDRARAHLETLVVDRGGSGPACGTGTLTR